MSGFPSEWLAELFARTDMAALVSEYVPLKPRGGRLWGCCPFHHEKTPSFTVSPDKQVYYCFGCHKGGSLVNFVMEMERVSYPDAIRMLADRAHMEIPEEIDERALKQQREKKERLYEANRMAARFFYDQLKGEEGRSARAYLARRGVSPQTAVEFGLGFAPREWEALTNALLKEGFSKEELVEAGLAVRSKKGEDGAFDMFRGRVVFPIIGTYQKVIGFGGRAMGDEQPKYLNTPDTPVFNKRYNLYGLNRLRGSSAGSLVLVEGYMDVVSLSQAGVMGAVATLGTALTPQQARLMKRYVPLVYVAYDGDDAGQNAILRALDIFEAEGMETKVIRFPGGLDPDEFIQKEGAAGFDELRQTAMSKNSFRLANLASRYDLATEDGRMALAHAGSALLARFSPVERERYTTELARLTGFSAEALREEAALGGAQEGEPPRKNSPSRLRNTKTAGAPRQSGRKDAELLLLKLADGDEGYRALLFEEPELLKNTAQRALLGHMLERGCGAEALLQQGLEGEEADCAAAVAMLPAVEDPEHCFADCAGYLRRVHIVEELKELQEKASDERLTAEERIQLVIRINNLNIKLDELNQTESERGEGFEH